VNKIHI